MPDFKAAAADILNDLIALRHELHQHPELGFEEEWTGRRLVEELREIPGLDIRFPIAGTGISATLNGKRPGRCVALRADIDALPIEEANSFEYKSRNEGRMHACGHDGHSACLIGAARVLARFADQLPGKVKFIFQPAEEVAGGAQRMIDEGVMGDPPVDAVFAFHGWPTNPMGSIQIASGPILAAMTSFEAKLTGTRTHAAYPHLGTDVILTASHIVTQLQAIPSRFTDPMDSVLVSITALHAGETHNTLSDRCLMSGTMRALKQSVHDESWGHIQDMVESTAKRFGVAAQVSPIAGIPVLVNDQVAAELVRSVGLDVLGKADLITDLRPSLGSEDFACFAQKVPSAMWLLGMRPRDVADHPNLHQPDFDFQDEVIPIAVAMHCRVAFEFLSRA